MKYDMDHNEFTFTMQPDVTISEPTEIFVPPYRYPNGYTVQLEPASAAFTWAVCPGHANKVCVSQKSSMQDADVSLKVTIAAK